MLTSKCIYECVEVHLLTEWEIVGQAAFSSHEMDFLIRWLGPPLFLIKKTLPVPESPLVSCTWPFVFDRIAGTSHLNQRAYYFELI